MVKVQLEVPEEWVQDLKDQAALLEILSLGLEEYRLQRALALYQRGFGSLGYVSGLVNLPERVVMEEARRRGVLPHHDERFAQQDLQR